MEWNRTWTSSSTNSHVQYMYKLITLRKGGRPRQSELPSALAGMPLGHSRRRPSASY